MSQNQSFEVRKQFEDTYRFDTDNPFEYSGDLAINITSFSVSHIKVQKARCPYSLNHYYKVDDGNQKLIFARVNLEQEQWAWVPVRRNNQPVNYLRQLCRDITLHEQAKWETR